MKNATRTIEISLDEYLESLESTTRYAGAVKNQELVYMCA